TPPGNNDRALIDSFRVLTISKVKLWNSVLELHQEAKGTENEFTEIYDKLEEQNFDTITTTTEKKGILRRIFGKPKIISDTTIVESNVQKEKLREEIQEIQEEISERDEQVNLLESNLITQNITITRKINQIITKAEADEVQGLIAETNEADRLAKLTFKRLAGFSVMAVLLLLLVVFLLSNYLKKRRKYELGLKNAREQAEILARAKEQFSANVSHEMRTPVNAIYGLAGQLLRRKNNDKLDEQISVLAQSASHLNQIINDTLDFSKIQAGKIRFDEVHFSPKAVFQEVYSLQKYSAVQKGISLKLNLFENLPNALLGDPFRLKQILINLIGNAIKFTDKGQVVFVAEATEIKGNKYELRMKVSDSGIGISKNDQKIIFDEFVQAENHEGKKYRGTGLGLTIVKKLVELQNGSIQVESEMGAGTTITVLIPFAGGDINKIKIQGDDAFEVPDQFKQIRVLIADDEEFNRFLFRAIFDKWNIQYNEATNGEEVVKMALSHDFDIVMMDVRMPRKTGIEATKAILREKPETKIIAITATDDQLEKEKCIEAGMLGFLPKPFSEGLLFSLIHSTVNSGAMQKPPDKEPDYIAEMKKLALGDEAFLKEMLALFVRSTEDGINKIKLAVEKKNWKDIPDLAHKIAPQLKHLENKKLYNNVKELENETGKQKVNEDRTEKLFLDIQQKIIRINQQFKTYLA
ncbi:MAG TPA: ATP-binding protein, partial [Prolixibacteraceae bacterium]|nr:ATP-binding protein [Prolixibacteraceae bacterium]